MNPADLKTPIDKKEQVEPKNLKLTKIHLCVSGSSNMLDSCRERDWYAPIMAGPLQVGVSWVHSSRFYLHSLAIVLRSSQSILSTQLSTGKSMEVHLRMPTTLTVICPRGIEMNRANDVSNLKVLLAIKWKGRKMRRHPMVCSRRSGSEIAKFNCILRARERKRGFDQAPCFTKIT